MLSDKSDVLLAQALVEYGVLSGILSTLENAFFTAQDQISRIDSSTWAVVGLVAFVLFVVWNRR